MTGELELAKAASMLAQRAPQEWREFCAELKSFGDHRMAECVGAKLDSVQIAQGQARMCAALHALLSDAVNIADGRNNRRA